MKTNKSSKNASTTGILAALAASSCCIPPVIAAITGIGGISSSLSWLSPLRPYFIVLAVLAIGYAWYNHFNLKKVNHCGCKTEKPKFYQTKGFLVGITLFAGISIAFPYYSSIFFPNYPKENIAVNKKSDIVQATIKIDGMTCAGCEHHVNKALNSNQGVISAFSSYKDGTAVIKFDKSKVSIDQLATRVETETGYVVTEKKIIEQ